MTAMARHRPAGTAGQPTWWASWTVRSAALSLPSEYRSRYRQEFLAELHGMPAAEQLHHATGLLSRAWTLRMALTEPDRLLRKEATMAKPWRCRLHLHHWRIESDYQGQRYRECTRCGAISGASMYPPGGGPGGL
jgi:hypothetical protein